MKKNVLILMIIAIVSVSCDNQLVLPNENELEEQMNNRDVLLKDGANGICGFNWADARDNFVDGWVIPSGLSSDDNYSTVQSKANTILSAFQDAGANTVRLPINPPSVLESWWGSYKGAIDKARSKGMMVILACWESASSKNGLVDNTTDFWNMWETVVDDYGGNSGVFFEVFNEPHGYSTANLISLYNSWLDNYPGVPQNRVVLGGTGYSENVSNIGGSFSNCLLSQHLYSWWGNYTTISEWQNDLSNRIGGYESRTILSEFGAPMTTGKNYTGAINGDADIAFIQAMTDYCYGGLASTYWPGLKDDDSYTLYTYDGSMHLTNSSGLERLQYAWGSGGGGGLSGTYQIVNRNSGKSLRTLNGSNDNATEVVQYTYGGHTYEQWNVVEIGTGVYNIIHVSSGKYADINGASTSPGANNIIWPDNCSANQRWNIVDQGGGYYHIINVYSGLLLDIDGASTANNANNIQWTDNGGNNQDWSFDAP